MDIDEKLIKEVQKYEALYDMQSEDYRKVRLKDEMWRLVARNVGVPVELAKQRWKNLRDNYRRYKMKEVLPSGSRQTLSQPYKYAQKLTFLDKFLNIQESNQSFGHTHSPALKRRREETSGSLYPTTLLCPSFGNLFDNTDKKSYNTCSPTNATATYTSEFFMLLANKINDSGLNGMEKESIHHAVSVLVNKKLNEFSKRRYNYY
ncbi:uncharacterized protein LOC119614212 [Lucilia sericata]|uniref:uncharacterized protein LOC119614212 n=1 Tax=Lucilia sericata TaxID=13632 RepID=UPI0018A8345A|nr:uncharacterized protein LOC119614212 [Lucilia sericata]